MFRVCVCAYVERKVRQVEEAKRLWRCQVDCFGYNKRFMFSPKIEILMDKQHFWWSDVALGNFSWPNSTQEPFWWSKIDLGASVEVRNWLKSIPNGKNFTLKSLKARFSKHVTLVSLSLTQKTLFSIHTTIKTILGASSNTLWGIVFHTLNTFCYWLNWNIDLFFVVLTHTQNSENIKTKSKRITSIIIMA